MQVAKEKIYNEFSRDLYWSRLIFNSDNQSKKTVVIFCASAEYLWDLFHTRDFKENELNSWHIKVIEKWQKLGDKIFENDIYYDVYAISEAGKANGLEFLKNNIKP